MSRSFAQLQALSLLISSDTSRHIQHINISKRFHVLTLHRLMIHISWESSHDLVVLLSRQLHFTYGPVALKVFFVLENRLGGFWKLPSAATAALLHFGGEPTERRAGKDTFAWTAQRLCKDVHGYSTPRSFTLSYMKYYEIIVLRLTVSWSYALLVALQWQSLIFWSSKKHATNLLMRAFDEL